MKSAGSLSERNQLCVTAVVMLKAVELIRNKIIQPKGEMASVREKEKFKDDKNLISELNQQIRN